MDWHSWLCKTKLEPGLVYEYSLVFSNNELEEDDIAHFDHDLLRSIGISIAKHRLEILKLKAATARTAKATTPWFWLRRQRPPVVPRLMAAVNKTRRSVAKYISGFVAAKHDDDGDASSSVAVIVVPRPRWSAAAHVRGGSGMLKRNRTLAAARGKQLGRSTVKKRGDEDDLDGGSSREIEGETRWESMFQDLKPT